MVFRRDSKVDAFQRQISALRHQLGGESNPFPTNALEPLPSARGESSYRASFPALDSIERESPNMTRDRDEQLRVRDEPAALPAIPSADTQTSVIAHTTAWNGNLESSGSLHVHGRIEGSVTARDDVFVAEEADVDAVISAASVTIAGNVRGSINCADRFEILPHGRVAGDIRSPVIVIHEGALVTGEIIMTAALDSRASSSSAVRAARGD